MNIVVYYVIQCGNDDVYVRSLILRLCTAFVRLIKVLSVLIRQFSSKVECFFFFSLPSDGSKLLEFHNNPPRQKYNQKGHNGTMHKLTAVMVFCALL